MSLSDKIMKSECKCCARYYYDKDVKEAVKELKESYATCGCICCDVWLRKIDEEMGEKLI